MNREVLAEPAFDCPYCGERITILADLSIDEQALTEDCEVCCRPMELRVQVAADGSVQIDARTADD